MSKALRRWNGERRAPGRACPKVRRENQSRCRPGACGMGATDEQSMETRNGLRTAGLGSPRLDTEAQEEGSLLARLIRRFRVADTPARFQQWACHAVRVGLRAEAVAWIPDRFEDPIFASGRLAVLQGHPA